MYTVCAEKFARHTCAVGLLNKLNSTFAYRVIKLPVTLPGMALFMDNISSLQFIGYGSAADKFFGRFAFLR
jgi:hypothetical protein